MHSKLISSIFLLFTLQICYSFVDLPFTLPQNIQKIAPSDRVGKPLILTPLLASKKFTEARQQSSVPPLLKDVVSNAGYFTVEPSYNSNLFFWFIRAEDSNWQKVPLLLWLHGGPGCSSLSAIFIENGPFYLAKDKLRRRKYAWTNQYNVLYIDQPVGTGYSFTNSSKGYINNQDIVADHLYKATTQFFQLYPELKKNEFYITGKSYAGKYIPAIAYKIHKLRIAGKCDFNLKGLFIQSAFFDPINLLHYSDFAYKIGLVDFHTKNNVIILEKEAASYIHSGLYVMALVKADELLEEMRKNVSFSVYDYTQEIGHDNKLYLSYLHYMQSSEIRRKIHVGNTSYSICSGKVFERLRADIMQSMKSQIEELLEHYPIAFVNGQLDVITAYPMVSQILQNLRWSGAFQYSQAKRQFLYDGNRLAGYYKVAGNLKDIFIRKAGHAISMNQPKVTLSVLQKFIDGKL